MLESCTRPAVELWFAPTLKLLRHLRQVTVNSCGVIQDKLAQHLVMLPCTVRILKRQQLKQFSESLAMVNE